MKRLITKKDGYTLIELITVLLIMSILASVSVPGMVGFIEKARKQTYLIEAQGVRRSLEMYLIEQDLRGDDDTMLLLSEMTANTMDSKNHPLREYLVIDCSDGASIGNIVLEEGTYNIEEFVYYIKGYKIEIKNGKTTIEKEKK